MTLPFPPRRSHLTGFWLALNLAALIGAILVGLWLGLGERIVLLPALFAATIAGGLAWRDGIVVAYRVWNRAARAVAAVGQWWIVALTYYLGLTVLRRVSGSRLDLAPPASSMWKPYPADRATNGAPATAAGWVRQSFAAARSADRPWWTGLLPLLLVLSLFPHRDTREDVPSNIYTLY